MSGSRRQFLQRSTLAAAGLGLSGAARTAAARGKPVAASDRLRFGAIGVKGMGWADLRSALQIDGVECVALCDVDRSVLDERKKDVLEMQELAPKLYGDYRKLLEDKDIDAVVIGTPDHWHCLILVDALAAGKHVYCEKPLANSIHEASAMLAAAKKSDRIVQIGQWQRSGEHYEEALALVRSGDLGNIRLVKTWAYQGWMKPVPVRPDSDPPAGVDYDDVAGAGAHAPVQPQPLPLQLPVVLGLRRRPDDGLGRARDRHRARTP